MDEILINTSTLGSQTQPAITAFRGTQFVAVWEDLNDGSIRGQMLSPDGTKTSNEFLVNVPDKPNTKRQRPAIVETPLGFAVAWNEQLPGGVPQLKLRAFDGDTLSGPEIQVSSAQVEPLVSARAHEPGARLPRHPVRRPPFQRGRERVVQGLFGQIEVAQKPDQAGQNAA